MARSSLADMRDAVTLVVPSPQLETADANRCLKYAHRTFAQYQWSYRRRETVLQTVAPYSTGTVTVSAGSGTVTGAGTAWTSAMVGRQIRIAGEPTFFYVGSVNVGAQTLTLADAQLAAVLWAAAGGGGKSYSLFQDQFAVPADVAVIFSQVGDWPLVETSLTEIDWLDPARTSTGSGTPDRWYWVRSKIASATESRYVGLWPVPGAAMTLRMPYLCEPPELVNDTDLPVCPSEVLELAAAVRACKFVHAKTGDQRWATQALACHQELFGTPQAFGVLQQALHDDTHRFGLPTRIGGTAGLFGQDEWALHDFEARGF